MADVSTAQLAKVVAERVGAPVELIEAVIREFLAEMVRELARGRRVVLHKYFTLASVVRKGRTMRVPGSTEPVQVPPRTKVVFRAGSEFRRWAETRLPGAMLPGTTGDGGATGPGGLHVDADDIRDALGLFGESPDPDSNTRR